MNTHNTIVNSIVKNGNTTNSIRWINPHQNISAYLVPARVAIRWSLCSFMTTVSTAIDSVYSYLKSITRNPMQTIKNCINAIPTTDAAGAVGFPFLGANYAVVKVEPLAIKSSIPKFGKV